MQRDVRIGNGRLFEILVDTAASALVLGFQLDRHARAVSDFDPLDAVFFDGFCRPSRRDLDPFASTVEDFGLVLLGVDLDFE